MAAGSPTISIDDPGTLSAGAIELRGTVSAGDAQTTAEAETTTVLFAVDLRRRTE